MIGVVKLEKHFGGHTVFEDISFAVNPGERVALVGANGSGKTTLLKIIAGLEQPDSGEVALGPGAQLGYLGQEGQLSAGRTLFEEMMEVFGHVDELEARLRQLEQEMGHLEGAELERLLSEYSTLQARYDHAEPGTIVARIHKVTGGLGFSQDDLNKRCELFSGGWQMRGALARLLLQAPDCLLLDEPTNHLDLEAMEWLEEYLLTYAGAVLMVSHDRVFLDKVSRRTLELRNADLEEYAGNYTHYLEESGKRYELRLQRYKNQQKKLEQERRFIERFRYKASLASRVKSRERMLAKKETIDVPEERGRSVRMSFGQSESSGSQVLKVKGLAKTYDHPIFDSLSFDLQRGDRLALVGANGSGKTTLLRILAGAEKPDSGRVRFDDFVDLVYFAQHQAEALDPTKTVLEEVEAVAPVSVTQTEVRTLLGCFLFTGDDVHKSVAVLSGGEKSRVALTKCVLTPSNMLLLDEPTNHLDIESREALQDALDLYEGTIIFVTHDRALMNHLATKVLDLSARPLAVFDGGIEEYRRKKQRELQRQRSLEKANEKSAPRPARSTAKLSATPQKAKRTPWKLEALEKKIFSLEEQLEELTARLADPDLYSDPVEQTRVAKSYEKVKQECDDLTALWEEMA